MRGLSEMASMCNLSNRSSEKTLGRSQWSWQCQQRDTLWISTRYVALETGFKSSLYAVVTSADSWAEFPFSSYTSTVKLHNWSRTKPKKGETLDTCKTIQKQRSNGKIPLISHARGPDATSSSRTCIWLLNPWGPFHISDPCTVIGKAFISGMRFPHSMIGET